jgi:hypothetical protein
MVQYSREDFLSGRVGWTDLTPAEWRERDGPGRASRHRYPGTSCLATIVPVPPGQNRPVHPDKSHWPIEAPPNYLSAYEVQPGFNPGNR